MKASHMQMQEHNSKTLLFAENHFNEMYVPPLVRLRCVRVFITISYLPSSAAQSTERTIYRMHWNCIDAYYASVRRMAYNMACNTKLCNISPSSLVHYTDEQMARGTIIETLQIQELEQTNAFVNLLREKYENVVKAHESKDIISCSKCKSQDIFYTQKQVRGADEAMTVFCTCINCKKSWTLS
jgi:DNA-directed RNA polymerase subunit M/transcription elongation factor TFIIS